MNFLKWYSFIILILCFIQSVYDCFKTDESLWKILLGMIIEIPIFVYILLS